MWILTVGTERLPLGAGDHVIGGTADGAVPLERLAYLAPSARLTVSRDGSVTVRRLSAGVVVRVDGQPLGAVAHELRAAARVDVGAVVLELEPVAMAASAVPGAPGARSAAATELAVPALDVVAHLVDAGSGRAHPVRDGEVVVGRDAACDIVLASMNVSRRHARVTARDGEVTITDESVNGTRVNGARITARTRLRHGDVISLHGEELRVEMPNAPRAPRAAAPAMEGGDATRLLPSAPSALGPDGARSRADAPRGGAPLATLEIAKGRLAGARFEIDRPVCALGRGELNDVRLVDDSVSTSHASLLFKAGAWYVVDLRSSNGTFVGGYRVAGERLLSPGCALRLGDVELTFQPRAHGPARRDPTRPAVGLVKRLSRLLGERERASHAASAAVGACRACDLRTHRPRATTSP